LGHNTITLGNIFILDRVDQQPLVLVETFNLTGQSRNRSHENTVLIQAARDVLTSPLFGDPFDASEEGQQRVGETASYTT
jgi:hypothetical protein